MYSRNINKKCAEIPDVRYIADRRLERIGLPKMYKDENPFEWMTQATDLDKEKNFFESRVTEYQTGGSLEWD